MGILGDLERLINEHASASVLKERIALAEDKYAALERKVKELDEANAKLQRENTELSRRIPPEHAAPQVEKLGDKVLEFLSQHPDVCLAQIAQALGISKELAEFHVEDLENSNMISVSYSDMSPATYRLDHEGRRYLVNKGMLR